MRNYNNMFKLILVFSLSLFGGTGIVHSASSSQISASADWNTFVITLNGSSLTDANYTDQRSDSRANAGYTDGMGIWSDSGYQSPWSTPTSAVYSILNATGTAQTTSAILQANALASADGVNNTYARAASNVYRIGYFNVASDTTLNVSVLFDIKYLFSYDPVLESVGAWTNYGLNLYQVNDQGISVNIGASSYVFALNGYSGVPDLNHNTWIPPYLLSSLSKSLAGGHLYGVDVFINTSADAGTPASASVPEPTVMLFLISGLIGLLGIGRKMKKQRIL